MCVISDFGSQVPCLSQIHSGKIDSATYYVFLGALESLYQRIIFLQMCKMGVLERNHIVEKLYFRFLWFIIPCLRLSLKLHMLFYGLCIFLFFFKFFQKRFHIVVGYIGQSTRLLCLLNLFSLGKFSEIGLKYEWDGWLSGLHSRNLIIKRFLLCFRIQKNFISRTKSPSSKKSLLCPDIFFAGILRLGSYKRLGCFNQ